MVENGEMLVSSTLSFSQYVNKIIPSEGYIDTASLGTELTHYHKSI